MILIHQFSLVTNFEFQNLGDVTSWVVLAAKLLSFGLGGVLPFCPALSAEILKITLMKHKSRQLGIKLVGKRYVGNRCLVSVFR